MFFKKGSLSLSINAIVVLILAVTILSLGLTFINNTFGGATSELDKSLKGIAEDRKGQLTSKCQDDLCLEQSSVTIGRNKKDTVLAVLNNKLDCTVEAFVMVGMAEGDSDTFETTPDFTNNWQERCQIIGFTSSEDNCQEHIAISTFQTQDLSRKTKVIIPIDITPKNTAESTTYRYKITVDGRCESDPTSRMVDSQYIDIIVE